MLVQSVERNASELLEYAIALSRCSWVYWSNLKYPEASLVEAENWLYIEKIGTFRYFMYTVDKKGGKIKAERAPRRRDTEPKGDRISLRGNDSSLWVRMTPRQNPLFTEICKQPQLGVETMIKCRCILHLPCCLKHESNLKNGNLTTCRVRSHNFFTVHPKVQ